ncbi:3-deoxy-D-manno-octulosonic acid transferase [Niveispirillum lacus]|uniref:3-deoxy-D-manno-octulosonic acid transferase n=1 Tax=Niveispirillum lacus TaxID=1981099 RepID=A0A255YTM2_9PROT|nr:3-deoxy-D-manno-octulosonic acid transferase [Niveispirillum lacus]OYQ32586.1 3-deoxy-D-manno-octulosonic acid transferase [Niveispirillum lacus]
MLYSLYRGLTHLAGPAVRRILDRRAARGKEDPARRHERLGRPVLPRPPAGLIWVHAASVGEALAVLPLVDRLLLLGPHLQVMVTTGTVTSAALMARRLPRPRAFHQYVPVDLPGAVDSFLAHWRPDLVLWVESEFWPNLLSAIRRAGIPCALINARLSARSFGHWRRLPGTARQLLSVFQMALAQTAVEAERLSALGIADVRAVGNLKYSAPPLPADLAGLAALSAAIGSRPVWTVASSHAGEEAMAIAAQVELRHRLPDALLLLVPRHPDRGGEVADLLKASGLSFARRSEGGRPGPGHGAFLMDTLGEMGLVFRLAPVTVMGGSFMPVGGHNPIEPALLNSAVIHGPHMFNFAEVVGEMQDAGGVLPVSGPDQIPDAVAGLLSDPLRRQAQAEAARAVALRNATAIDRVMAALSPLLNRAGVG